MNLILPIFSLFLLILLQTVFYNKERIASSETNIYKYLMLISTCNIIFNIIGIYTGYHSQNMKLLFVLNHLDLPTYFWWASLMFLYLLSVDMDDPIKYKKLKKVFLIITTLLTVITLFLPFDVILSETEGYAAGFCVNFVYIISGIYILLSLIEAFKITKKGYVKKAIPIFSLLILGIVAALIQKNIPNLIIIPAMIVFIELIMYFTIENPDLKLLNEYLENRELAESNLEDKANMLFKISEDVKSPIRKISLYGSNISSSNDLDEIHNNARSICTLSDNVTSTLDNILNISEIDKTKLRSIESTYNIYNLYSQIIYFVKSRIKGNIDFKYSISNNIPDKLYGDVSKLKQIICSILLYSSKEEGKQIIDLDIDSIIRYDVCRLIITLRNTASAISLTRINEILANNEMSEKELEQIDNFNLDLKLCKKVIDVLGGNLLIKSDKSGNTFTIVLNQLIEQDSDESTKTVEKLSKIISNKKRVLLIEDDYKMLQMLSKELKRNDYEVVSTMYGKDCVDRINNNEVFDLLLIDDEMENYNAVKTIKELDLDRTKKTKIIVMLNKDKESIKEHYLEDYPFDDYLLKNDYINEIKRIKEKY